MSEAIRRANTIKLSRPEVWVDIIKDRNELEACEYRGWYILGDLQPNYPVPAIRLAVTIDYEFVAIWRVGIDCVYYRDDYETVHVL